MSESDISRVFNATVLIGTKAGLGQGVLVTGGMILTAAHCLWFTTEGAQMAMDEYHVENILARNGACLRAATLAVDPVSDIAVLGWSNNTSTPKKEQKAR